MLPTSTRGGFGRLPPSTPAHIQRTGSQNAARLCSVPQAAAGSRNGGSPSSPLGDLAQNMTMSEMQAVAVSGGVVSRVAVHRRRRPLSPAPAASSTATGAPGQVATTPANKGAMVTCNFLVPVYDTMGMPMVLVGGAPELGNWEISKGMRMVWNQGHMWQGSVELPLDLVKKGIEFKFALLKDPTRGVLVWEPSDNRTLTLPEGAEVQPGVAYQVVCPWARPTETSVTPYQPLSPDAASGAGPAGPAGAAAPASKSISASMAAAALAMAGKNGAGDPSMKRVQIVVPRMSLPAGHHLALVGGCDALGNWDPAKGAVLRQHQGEQWHGSVKISAEQLGKGVEAKLVVVQRGPNGALAVGDWEEVGIVNRMIKVHDAKPGPAYILICPWGVLSATTMTQGLVVPPPPMFANDEAGEQAPEPAAKAPPAPAASSKAAPAAQPGAAAKAPAAGPAAAGPAAAGPTYRVATPVNGPQGGAPPKAQSPPQAPPSPLARPAVAAYSPPPSSAPSPSGAAPAKAQPAPSSSGSSTPGPASTSGRNGASPAGVGAPSSSGGGPAIIVDVVVPGKPVARGQFLVLVGEGPALGDWDPSRGVQLTRGEGDQWRGKVSLPAGDIRRGLEAKLVVGAQVAGGRVVPVAWESRGPHAIKVVGGEAPAASQPCTLTVQWDQPEGTGLHQGAAPAAKAPGPGPAAAPTASAPPAPAVRPAAASSAVPAPQPVPVLSNGTRGVSRWRELMTAPDDDDYSGSNGAVAQMAHNMNGRW